jgi:hypothetical protein
MLAAHRQGGGHQYQKQEWFEESDHFEGAIILLNRVNSKDLV